MLHARGHQLQLHLGTTSVNRDREHRSPALVCACVQGATSWLVMYLIQTKGAADAAQVRLGGFSCCRAILSSLVPFCGFLLPASSHGIPIGFMPAGPVFVMPVSEVRILHLILSYPCAALCAASPCVSGLALGVLIDGTL